jgi:hypothetical protein
MLLFRKNQNNDYLVGRNFLLVHFNNVIGVVI